ncbi:MAG: hypothetical protein C5B50_11595 [Verrucomicrobia bacterium]|nr:MAG: hypothetical protein C5B50_11595 [Verrucomicrobiota bacterium]
MGVAPVVVPAGGFGICGNLMANSPWTNVGNWCPSTNSGTGGYVLSSSGMPLNPSTTFHIADRWNSTSDNTFSGGLKWTDDPNSWTWVTSKASSKTDINNVLFHFGYDTNGHTWIIVAADRFSNSGDSYIDFEFLQNSLTISNTSPTSTNSGTFHSTGPNGGRTTNDFLLSLAFTGGGSTADFFCWQWQTNIAGGFNYADITSLLPSNGVFVAANSNTVVVPFGAFGSTNYLPLSFADAAVDVTSLLGNFNPCFSIGIKTILVKTKSSQSGTSTINDFINPIQYSIKLGPSADPGPAQSNCWQGASTAFTLQGQATAGIQPVTNTLWTLISGSATIDSPNSLITTAYVSSASARLRLTVNQVNGCTESNDVVLTVLPLPACSISGPALVCPLSTSPFTGPPGMGAYSWSVSGSASIQGGTNAQTVSVKAANACATNYTLMLTVVSNGCSSFCATNVTVDDTVLPALTIPPDRVLQCPANTGTNSTGVATATDNCSAVFVSYSDLVTTNCGGTRVIARTWTATDLCGNSTNAVQTITLQDTNAPTITPPPNVTLECPADSSTNHTGMATAADTCSAVTITYNDAITTNCGGAYTLTRTWIATDACGNSASTNQILTVRDTTRPTITLPPNVTLECPADISTNNTGMASAQDTCSSVTITFTDSVTNHCGGTQTISRKWIATDACGNSTNAVQTITVRDTTAPALNLPPNVTLECPADTSTNSTGAATAQDTCSALTIRYSDSVVTNCGGTRVISRTWTATDACSNSVSAVQTITLRDTTPPSLSLPPNKVLQCPANVTTNNTGTATAQDACSAPVAIRFSDSVTNPCPGSSVITRTWTATDACGNSTNGIQMITVQDTNPPTITPPQNVTLECPADTSTNHTGMATASDTCSAVTITYSDAVTNNCGGSYTLTRTWTATDACGNSASTNQTVTVRDTTRPTINLPANVTLECPADTTTNNTGMASAQDTCSAVTITYVDSVTNHCGGTQTISRKWTATDACGNSTNAVQTITVRDTTPPLLSMPPSMTLECPANTSTNNTGVATASDTCSAVTVRYSDSVTTNCGGTEVILRTWTAADACSNSVSAVQTITVRDTTPPSLSLPSNKVLQCPANTATNNTGSATSQDTCSSPVTIRFSDSVTNPCPGSSVITRTWTATDACGNSTNGVQTITVQDTSAPSLSLPANITLECPANTTTNNTGVATAQDACSAVTVSYADQVTTNCGNTKVIARTWTATDACGNSTNGVQTITVRDTTPPSLSLPSNKILSCPADTTTNNTGAAMAQDGCSAPVTISFVDTVTNPCAGSAIIKRTWTATDACGNSTNGVQTITVQDNNPPSITPPPNVTLECPANTSTNFTGMAVGLSPCTTVTVAYTDSVTTNCGGTKSIARTWTATDACGNSSSAVQTITVRDTAPPALSLPSNKTLQCPADSSTNSTGVATAQDTCSSPVTISFSDVVTNPCPGTRTITRTWTARDACGNTTNGIQMIIVQDTTPPALSIPPDVTRECPGDSSTNTTGVATAIDACSSAVVTCSDTVSNNCGGGRIVYRKWTATDSCGNVTNRIQTITIQDTTKPTFLTIPTNVVLQCPANTTTNNTGTATAQDTCSAVTVRFSDSTSNICSGAYVISRNWIATDACGNSTNAIQTITVVDTVGPSLSLPPDLTLECGANTSPSSTGTATGQDACSSVTVTYSDSVSNICGGSRVIRRTWTVADGCGNRTNGVQTISVLDRTPPSISLAFTPPCTFSQGGWSGGGSPANLVASSFGLAFPNGLTLGIYNPTNGNTAPNGLYWQTNSAGVSALQAAFSQGSGSGGPITQDALNPTITYGAGGCGRQTLALMCNIAFNSLGMLGAGSNNFGGLIYTNTGGDSLSGLSVNQIVTVINQALGGLPLPAGYDFSGLSGMANNLNISFEACSESSWAQQHLIAPWVVMVQCPQQVPPPSYSSVTASDTCSSPVTITNLPDLIVSNICPSQYTIKRTFVATDACGNTNSVSYFIQVSNSSAPSLTVPADMVLECPASTATNITGVATAQNSCGPMVVSYSDVVSNTCGGASVTYRTWTANAGCSTAVSRVQKITLRDTTPPTLAVPSNQTLQCPADTSTNNTGVATAQDTCSAVAISYSDAITNPCAGAQVITRTWTATDACGNTTNGTQTITVQNTTPPSLVLPPNMTLQCPADTSTNLCGCATALGACAVPTVTCIDTVSNLCGGGKIVYRKWVASDACGNTTNGLQTITVLNTTRPSLSLPPDLTLECGASTNSTSTGTATGQEACGAVTVTFSDSVSNICGGSKIIRRTWTVADACGNSTNGVQTISVLDRTPPHISIMDVPATIYPCASQVPAHVGDIFAYDTCSGPLTVTNLPDTIVSNICPTHFTIKRTIVALDACGNSNTASIFLVVSNGVPPALHIPPDIVLECPASTSTNVTGVATAQGACGPALVGYSDVVSNTCGGASVTYRTWIATDGCNTTNRTQIITLRDSTPPSLSIVSNITVAAGQSWNFGWPVATDKCSGFMVLVINTVTNMTSTNTLSATRTWEARDVCGNISYCQQTVTMPLAPFKLTGSALAPSQFLVTTPGIPGCNLIIQVSTNLVNWTTLTTNPSPTSFMDTNISKYPRRFFRAQVVP